MYTSWPPETAPRSDRLSIRLSAAELALLARKARAANLSVSAFARLALPLEHDTPPVDASGARDKTGNGGLDDEFYRD